MSKFAIKILCPLGIVLPVQWMSMGCPLDIPPSLTKLVPLSCPIHCTMGQVGMGLSMGVHCPIWGPSYHTVCPIPLYHGTGGTVHGSPLSHLRTPISHCPSYLTVPWDRWDCPWESTVPPEDPHIPLSVLSHCTMGIGGTVHGSPLSHLRTPISHCPSYPHCTMGHMGLSMGVHCPTWGPPYHTVCPIPLYHGIGGTVHGCQLTSHPHWPGLSECPVDVHCTFHSYWPGLSTCPMDVNGTTIAHPPSLIRLVHLSNGRPWDDHCTSTLTDQACPPVQWTSMGRPLHIPLLLTRLVHLSNGRPWDDHCTSTLTDQACPPVQWTSMGRPLHIHPHWPGLSTYPKRCA